MHQFREELLKIAPSKELVAETLRAMLRESSLLETEKTLCEKQARAAESASKPHTDDQAKRE